MPIRLSGRGKSRLQGSHRECFRVCFWLLRWQQVMPCNSHHNSPRTTIPGWGDAQGIICSSEFRKRLMAYWDNEDGSSSGTGLSRIIRRCWHWPALTESGFTFTSPPAPSLLAAKECLMFASLQAEECFMFASCSRGWCSDNNSILSRHL